MTVMATEGPATATAASERPPAGEDAPQPMSLRCRRACRSGFQKEDVESVAEIAVTIAPDFRLSLSRGAAENQTWDVNPTEGRNNRNFDI